MGRIASIDYGVKRIGVALSDESKIIASCLTVVQAEKTSEKTVEKVLLALAPYQIETLIVGLPLHMNGKKGFLADEVHHFVALLKQRVSFQILLWDERLSTVQAERTLREANLSRKKRAPLIDSLTALILLQSYLPTITKSSI